MKNTDLWKSEINQWRGDYYHKSIHYPLKSLFITCHPFIHPFIHHSLALCLRGLWHYGRRYAYMLGIWES